jgi:hypothetical protein
MAQPDATLTHATLGRLELTPLCALPCSIRFAIWCFRVAKLSAQGSDCARLRLREVHNLLRKPNAATALERCIALLLDNARRPLDIREFGLGSVYSSQTELDLLAALSELQAGGVARARGMLAGVVSAHLSDVLAEAEIWTAELKEAGILLPQVRQASH